MVAGGSGISFWDLFNAKKPGDLPTTVSGLIADDVPTSPSRADHLERQGVFVTPQSLTSFAGASAAVSGLWSLAGKIRPAWAGDTAVGLVIAVTIGLIIYIISERDPANANKKAGDRAISFLVAAINTAFLFSAALGVTGSAEGAGGRSSDTAVSGGATSDAAG